MAEFRSHSHLLKILNTNTKLSLRKLQPSDLRDRSAANTSLATPDNVEEEEERWKYFFNTGCENWFETIKDHTFTSTFCSLTPTEAGIIVKHHEDRTRLLALAEGTAYAPATAADTQLEELFSVARSQLSSLKLRLDEAVNQECHLSACNRAFVKLATRSPKDAKVILKNATKGFQRRLQDITGEVDDNAKWIMLSEEVTIASSVSSADEAIDMLLDSARVFEDLEYALRGPPLNDDPITNTTPMVTVEKSSANDNTIANIDNLSSNMITCDRPSSVGASSQNSRQWSMNLVARAWDPRLKPMSEFRGICWDNKLTCLAQYYHPLYFEELQDTEFKAQIERDIIELFEKGSARKAVAQLGGHCIIDFAWLEKGEVVIVELNPFDGVCLGTFPASTGLFLFENPTDQSIIKGISPFEFRIRESKMTPSQLLSNCNLEWRDIIKMTPSQLLSNCNLEWRDIIKNTKKEE